MTIFYGYVLSYIYLFGVIFLIGLLQKLIRFDVEISRKIIHFFIGFVWLILYRYHAGTWHFVVVPASFVVINYLSYRFKLFKMFEREDEEKNHFGTVFYALSITVMSAVSLIWEQTLLPYGVAVFCLAFGDAAAALAGGYMKPKIPLTKDKTLFGTLAAILFSILGIFLFMAILPLELQLWQVILVGVASGLLELAGKGLDNFTVPFGVLALTTVLVYGV